MPPKKPKASQPTEQDRTQDVSFTEHFFSGRTWLRILFMLLFGVVFYLVEILVAVVAVVQVLFSLLSGRVNPRLRLFGASLGVYMRQIIAFLTFYSEDRPFPFNPWPSQAPEFLEQRSPADDAGGDDDIPTDGPAQDASRE